MEATSIDPVPTLRPKRDDIDIFGVSHPGRVRSQNQDHFLVASLHKVMQVHHSSLPGEQLGSLISPSRGYVFLVADGLGGLPGGEQASGTALRAVADYVTQAMGLYTQLDSEREPEFLAELTKSVERSHQVIQQEAERAEQRGMATTLTMVTIRWPRAFVVHVGDSRCYRLRDGRLERMTRDQTMAQAMVEAGAMTAEQAERTRLKHVLYSALGGKQAAPEVLTTTCEWNDVMLLCSDGLTKHVSDDEIRDQILAGNSSEAICRALVDRALERGGSDNVTVVVGRLKARDSGAVSTEG